MLRWYWLTSEELLQLQYALWTRASLGSLLHHLLTMASQYCTMNMVKDISMDLIEVLIMMKYLDCFNVWCWIFYSLILSYLKTSIISKRTPKCILVLHFVVDSLKHMITVIMYTSVKSTKVLCSYIQFLKYWHFNNVLRKIIIMNHIKNQGESDFLITHWH